MASNKINLRPASGKSGSSRRMKNSSSKVVLPEINKNDKNGAQQNHQKEVNIKMI